MGTRRQYLIMFDGPIDPFPWLMSTIEGRLNRNVIEGGPALLGGLDHAVTVAGLAIGIVGLVALGLFVRDRVTRDDDRSTKAQSDADDPVLTDRERVQKLLKDNGGRMKQAEIVESVEWSKAKVSRLLADLESDGEITKLRLGRENLICQPGSEPAASRSTANRSGSQSADE